MPIEGRTESGFLVLADISGFTAFVTATELEHGAQVTGVLLGDVMQALSPPLEIQELEGDAVFALGPDAASGGGPASPGGVRSRLCRVRGTAARDRVGIRAARAGPAGGYSG